MTDTTLAVAVSADDAQQSGTTPTITSADFLLTATDHYVGLRFNNVPIAQGQIVSAAYVDMVITDSSKNDAEGTWYGQAADNPATFTTTSNDITARTSTSATVSWTTNDLGTIGQTISSPNLATIIQEIVNRAGWAKGNSIVLIYDHNSATDKMQLATYDNTTYTEPRLRLTYSGIGKVADRGATGNTNAGGASSFNVDMAAAGSITAGNWLIMRAGLNNSGTLGAAVTLTVDDARNSSWTVVGPSNYTTGGGAPDNGATAYIAYVKVNNTYTNGDDVTCHFSPAVTGQAIVIEEWTNIDSVTPLAGITPTTSSGTTTTPSTSITPTAAGQLVYGNIASEGYTGDTWTVDADTTDGTWKDLTGQDAQHTNTLGDVKTRGQWKIVTGTSAQSWTPTITSRDEASLLVVFGVYSGQSRTMAAKVPISSEVDSLFKRVFNYTVKANTSSSAKSPLSSTKRFANKVAASTNFKGNFIIGGSVAFAARVPTTSNSRLRRVTSSSTYIPQARAYQSKPATSNNAKATTKVTKRVIAKATQSANAKGRLSYKRSLTVVGATNKPKISSKAKATLDTTTAGGNAPAIPATVLTAQPAALLIGWGGGASYSLANQADFVTWRGWGPRGCATRSGNNFLYGFGNGYDSQGSSAHGLSGGQWNYQKLFEGEAVAALAGANSGPFVAKENGTIDWVGINVKLVHTNYRTSWGGPSPNPPAGYSINNQTAGAPWAQWWDDTTWAQVCTAVGRRAAMVNFLGGDGLVFDPEDQGNSSWNTGRGYHRTTTIPSSFGASGTPVSATDYGVPTGGHTEAQQCVQVEQRGFEFGSSIYQNFPNCDILIYQWQDIEGSWQPKQGIHRLGRIWHLNYYMPNQPSNHSLFFMGIMRAHQVYNSQGKIGNASAWWYRDTSQWSGVPSAPTALLWDSQGSQSTISRALSTVVRNQVMPYWIWFPMSWAGTEGARGDQEPEPDWTDGQKKYHDYGMGGMRIEYNYDGTFTDIAGHGLYTGHDNYAYPPGRLTNWQPSLSTASHNSTPITVSTIAQNRSGNTVTLTFTATHPFGLHHVNFKLYASNGTSVLYNGEAVMNWRPSATTTNQTHDPTTGIPNQYMECTCTVPNATTGLYVIVTVYSASNQHTSRRVQMA